MIVGIKVPGEIGPVIDRESFDRDSFHIHKWEMMVDKARSATEELLDLPDPIACIDHSPGSLHLHPTVSDSVANALFYDHAPVHAMPATKRELKVRDHKDSACIVLNL